MWLKSCNENIIDKIFTRALKGAARISCFLFQKSIQIMFNANSLKRNLGLKFVIWFFNFESVISYQNNFLTLDIREIACKRRLKVQMYLRETIIYLHL